MEVHRNDYDLLDSCIFGQEAVNGAQNVRIDTTCRKDDQQNYKKNDNVITNRLKCLKIVNNPVYKLTTDNLQRVLINVLIRSIFEFQSFTR